MPSCSTSIGICYAVTLQNPLIGIKNTGEGSQVAFPCILEPCSLIAANGCLTSWRSDHVRLDPERLQKARKLHLCQCLAVLPLPPRAVRVLCKSFGKGA